jgi:hypothetical protein
MSFKYEAEKGVHIMNAIEDALKKLKDQPDNITRGTFMFNDVSVNIYWNSRIEDVYEKWEFRRQLDILEIQK